MARSGSHMNENFAHPLAAVPARIAAARLTACARTPNADERTVSGLTPYITHGFVTRAEVLAGVAVRPAPDVQHKFFVELGGRACFCYVTLRRVSCSEDLAVGLLAVNEVPAC